MSEKILSVTHEARNPAQSDNPVVHDDDPTQHRIALQ
jgi:hypothetical protein